MTHAIERSLLRAACLGAMAGIRSMSAPAVLGYQASRNGQNLKGTPFALLASPNAAKVLAVFSFGEMVADKLPFLPNRTDPLPLLGRLTSGAVTGTLAFIEDEQPPLAGAAVGAAAALISTFASFNLRRALNRHMPNPVGGLVGDACVTILARVFLRA